MGAPRQFGLGVAGTSVAWAFLSGYAQAPSWRGDSGRSRLELICRGRELTLIRSSPVMGLVAGRTRRARTCGTRRYLGSSRAGSFCPCPGQCTEGSSHWSLESSLPHGPVGWERLCDAGSEPELCWYMSAPCKRCLGCQGEMSSAGIQRPSPIHHWGLQHTGCLAQQAPAACAAQWPENHILKEDMARGCVLAPRDLRPLGKANSASQIPGVLGEWSLRSLLSRLVSELEQEEALEAPAASRAQAGGFRRVPTSLS